MAYDPMEGFQVGQAIGKSKGSAYGGTAKYMSDLTAERDKSSQKANPFELLAMKSVIGQPETDAKIAKMQAETDAANAKASGVKKITDSLAETQSANDLLSTLESLSTKIGDVGNPLQAGIKSAYNKYISGGRGTGSMDTGRDEALSQYNSISPAGSAAIYRALTGDKRLSDDDAQKRAVPLLWRPGESESVKQKKFSILKSAIQQRTDRLANGQFSEIEDPTKGTLHLTDDIYTNALKSLNEDSGSTQQSIPGQTPDMDKKKSTKEAFYSRMGY